MPTRTGSAGSNRGRGVAKQPSRPNGALSRAPLPPPDLKEALQSAGLQQYSRRLEEMGYVRMSHILRLSGGALHELLHQQLKLLPGHRVRMVNLIEERRARARPAGGLRVPKPLPVIVHMLRRGTESKRPLSVCLRHASAEMSGIV